MAKMEPLLVKCGAWDDPRRVARNPAIPMLQPFRTSTNNLRGIREKDGTGRLPREWRDVFYNLDHHIDYIVYSYGTPIAWHVKGKAWVVPNVKYSITTTQHQTQVKMALDPAINQYATSEGILL